MAISRLLPITIDPDEVDASLSDFPMLISRALLDDEVVDPSGSNEAQSDGGDLRFFSDAGTTQQPLEVVGFELDSSTGADDAEVQLWGLVPSVSSVVDTTVYLGYGSGGGDSQPSASDTYGSQNVWDSGFEGVWHCNNDPSGSAPQVLDSTANGYHGTAANMESGDLQTVGGLTGLQFDGSNERVTMDSDIQTAMAALSQGTIESIVQRPSSGSVAAFGFINQGGNRFGIGWYHDNNLYGVCGGYWSHGSTSTDVHHIAVVNRVSNNMRNVMDGVEVSNGGLDANIPATLDPFYIGYWDSVGYSPAKYREVRCSNVERSLEWLAATTSTSLTPATFAAAGTPTSAGGGGSEYDETGAGNITIGGSAAVQVTYSPAASGGAIVGGGVTPSVTNSQSGAGGLIAGGAAAVQATYNPAAAGGVVLAGAGDVQADYGPDAAGGVVIGGAADLGASEYSEVGSGGAVLGGTSLVQATYGIEASGGAIIGGSASLGNQEFSEVASGGAVIAGSADVQQTSSLIGAGGAVLSGTAGVQYIASVLASGGAVLGGVAIVSAIYGIEASGGVVLGGTALVSGTLGLTKYPGAVDFRRLGLTSTLRRGGMTSTLARQGLTCTFRKGT